MVRINAITVTGSKAKNTNFGSLGLSIAQNSRTQHSVRYPFGYVDQQMIDGPIALDDLHLGNALTALDIKPSSCGCFPQKILVGQFEALP